MVVSLELKRLQLTDILRRGTIQFLQNLTNEQINAFSETKDKPQVWRLYGINYLSEGNNRAAILASRSQEKLEVEYHDENDPYSFLAEPLIEKAEVLRTQGIFTPHDLWKLKSY